MKFGVRKPSVKKSVKARTTGKWKRQAKSAVNPLYGEKGTGFAKNPKKAVYNKAYNKTTFSAFDTPKGKSNKKSIPNNTTSNDAYFLSAQSILTVINDSINILNTTNNPSTFFSRFDLLLDRLDDFIEVLPHIDYIGLRPQDYKDYLIDNQHEYFNRLIKAYHDQVQDKISSLKTEKAKINNANKFNDTLIDGYSNYFNDDNLKYINDLYNDLIDTIK